MNPAARILTDATRFHQLPATFHADTFLCTYQERLYVLKQIGKQYTYFRHETAVTLVHLLHGYYQRLLNLPVPVPEEFACWAEHDMVYCVSRYCGKPLRTLAEGDDTLRVAPLIEIVLAIIAELFRANDLEGPDGTTDSSWLTLSLDVSPDNFTLDDAGRLRYVDFTPPLLKTQREEPFQVAFIPTSQRDEQPTWKNFRYFHRLGVLLTLLTKFWAAWPQHAGILHDHLARFLNQPRHQAVVHAFRACPAIQVYRLVQEGRKASLAGQQQGVEQKRRALHRLISDIPAAERDQLRLCVLLLTPRQLELLDGTVGNDHAPLASARENHTRFFHAVFSCYKSSHAHDRLQHLVMSLADLALMPSSDLAFRQADTALLSLLLPPS